MKQYKQLRGFAVLPVLVVVALVAVAVAYYASQGDDVMEKTASPSPSAMMEKKEEVMEKTASPSPSAMMEKKEEGAMMKKATVQEYTKAAYDAAVASGKPVVLYYYADWCPICKVQYPLFQSAAASYDGSTASFFRVNYSDSEATADETASAKEHQVGYQHTVVIVKNGAQVYKSQDTGNYATRFAEYLK